MQYVDYKEHINEIWAALEQLQEMRYDADPDNENDSFDWDNICHAMAQIEEGLLS